MSSRSLSKAEKSLFLVCVLALVPLAAVVFIAGQRDAEPNWNITPAPPRPNPNGYDYYVAAAKATVRFTPQVDAVSDNNLPANTDPINSPYALKNYSLARRQKWLKANTTMFALLKRGLIMPSLASEYSTQSVGDRPQLRQLARDIAARSRTFEMQHQPMRATMSTLDGLEMAQDSTRGGGVVLRLVATSMMIVGRDPLEDWNKTINSLQSDEACVAARRLETILSSEPDETQTLLADKRDNLLELRRIFTKKNWRGSWEAGTSEFFTNMGEDPGQIWQRQTISKKQLFDNMNCAFDLWIASIKLPYSKAVTTRMPTTLDALTRNLLGLTERYTMNEARNSTGNNILLLRLALRAFIGHNKTAPTTLSALVPAYLKAIPTDIYNDGKPLFYTPSGATYKLWSVGPDGINDGGVPLARKRSDKPNRPTQNLLDNKGDFVAGLCR